MAYQPAQGGSAPRETEEVIKKVIVARPAEPSAEQEVFQRNHILRLDPNACNASTPICGKTINATDFCLSPRNNAAWMEKMNKP
jgi:hypothetical protein